MFEKFIQLDHRRTVFGAVRAANLEKRGTGKGSLGENLLFLLDESTLHKSHGDVMEKIMAMGN
jgi:hypothetical protein